MIVTNKFKGEVVTVEVRPPITYGGNSLLHVTVETRAVEPPLAGPAMISFTFIVPNLQVYRDAYRIGSPITATFQDGNDER